MKAPIFMLFFVALWCGVVPLSQAARVSDEVQITTASPEARSAYQQALILANNIRFDDARSLFTHATKLDSQFAMAHYMLAVFAPNEDDGISHLSTALSLTDRVTEGERLLIEALHAQFTGSPSRCEELTRTVLQMHPEDVWTRQSLGAFLVMENRHEEAIAEFERILTIQPGYPPAWNLLGYANMALGRNEAAETAFKRYIDALPNEPNPYDSYAEFLMKLGRYDESIRTYEKALTLDKNFHSATVGIANDLIHQGHPAAARLRFQTLYENAGTTEWKRSALSGLIRAFVSEGKYERAIAEAKHLRDISLREKNALQTVGDLQLISALILASGSVDPKSGVYLKSPTAEARRINQVTVTLHDAYRTLDHATAPEKTKTRTRMALLTTEIEAAVQENDLVTARRKADEYRAWASTSGDPATLQTAARLRGIIAVAERRYADALEDLQQADLTNPRTLFRLMEVHEALGNTVEARDVRRKILAVNDGSLQFAMVKRWIAE